MASRAGDAVGPTGRFRILQVHPTRRCNLRCLHCYSSSGPEEEARLEPEVVRRLLTGARDEGYTVVGFSGGEPLLYPALREVLEHAKALGLTTTVTSNGMLLDERRVDVLAGAADLLAISLDGVPESHNRLRASSRAFETMVSRLDGVRRAGIPFGFIFTLTQYNLDELDWVARFCLEQGASLLQIHPLELAGRARENLADERPDATEAAWAYVAALELQASMGERLRVHLDLADREVLRAEPSRAFAAPETPGEGPAPLGSQLSPLIVETDGTLVPVQYGFPRRYALGNVRRESLAACAAHWRRHLAADFRALCRRTFDELVSEEALPVTNWYERIARRAAAEEDGWKVRFAPRAGVESHPASRLPAFG